MATNSEALSVGQSNHSYDPLKDQSRRPKSNDPGWKYAYYVEAGKRELIQCALCPKQIKGGIKRVKQHLAGGYGDIVKCPNTTREISKEMNEALNNGKRARPLYLDDDVLEDEAGQDDDVQVMGSRSMSASSKASSCTVPSPGTTAKRNKAIFQLKPHPIAAPKKLLNLICFFLYYLVCELNLCMNLFYI
jgi:hypothetical protein